MKATHTIVLYTENEIIAEVFEGETYLIPDSVKVFNGTIDEFLEENPSFEQWNNGQEIETLLTPNNQIN